MVARLASLWRALAVGALLLALGGPPQAAAEAPLDPAAAVGRAWARADGPVAAGVTSRTWLWGPDPITPIVDEPYAEGPGGRRPAQYFDKARMEVTRPDGVTAARLVPETSHTVASVFWDFLQTRGPVDDGGIVTVGPLFEPPFAATGLPVTEAYWATATVDRRPRQVLVQAFERRVLTYTPGNPPGFEVEAGNVGRHYYTWRYGQGAPPAAGGDPAGPTATLLAAGDIADCGALDGARATATLLDGLDGAIATLGDNAYPGGADGDFRRCYAPTWGRHLARTRPAPGNHDYRSPGAAGYFGYFGAAAGPAGRGYYSYDLGAWHLVALNSNCAAAGGGETGSPQERWLRADLAAHPARCTLAYWHHPRFSSGKHGSQTAVAGLWQALYDAGADVVLSGHDHDYERFAPLNPAGRPDPARGLRQFVVGTGGRSHYPIGAALPGSEARNDDSFGILKLTLAPASYRWEFVSAAGATFTDTGAATCHGRG